MLRGTEHPCLTPPTPQGYRVRVFQTVRTGPELPTSLRTSLSRPVSLLHSAKAPRPVERVRDNSIGQTRDRVHPGLCCDAITEGLMPPDAGETDHLVPALIKET